MSAKKTAFFTLLTLAGFLIFPQTSRCQDAISAFISSSTEDLSLKLYDNQIQFLNNKTYRMAPIQGLQLRAQNNEFGSDKNEVSLRVTPANPWEIRNTNRFFRSYKAALAFEKDLMLKEVLLIRYELILSMLYEQEMKELREEVIKNINGQVTIFERQNGSSFFDAKDYVDLKLEYMQEQTDLEESEFELIQKFDEIRKQDPKMVYNSSEWTYNLVIPVEDLSEIVDSLISADLYTTTTSFYKEKISMANYDYKLEKNNFNIGFVQPEFNPYRTEGENPIGISFGVSIPLFNPNKGDMAEKKLERIEAESELAVETKLAENEVSRLNNTLKNLIHRYDNIQKKLDAFSIDETFETVGALNSSNPLIFLKFNEQILKLKKLQAEVKYEVFYNYVYLLAQSDLLHQPPLTNFLSKNLRK
ncbi:MAG TPA: hypothetical protein VD908_14120 [Cytophagales bacterium]|nr:hypothetical protein [Cytophagales bacterium]